MCVKCHYICHLQRWFIDALIDLFDQESEYVIDVIEDCREEMRETADKYKDEADQLRAASRMLGEQIVVYVMHQSNRGILY